MQQQSLPLELVKVNLELTSAQCAIHAALQQQVDDSLLELVLPENATEEMKQSARLIRSAVYEIRARLELAAVSCKRAKISIENIFSELIQDREYAEEANILQLPCR